MVIPSYIYLYVDQKISASAHDDALAEYAAASD